LTKQSDSLILVLGKIMKEERVDPGLARLGAALLLVVCVGISVDAFGRDPGDRPLLNPWYELEEPIPTTGYGPILDQLDEDTRRLQKARQRLLDIATDFLPNLIGLGQDVNGLVDDLFGPLSP
jgi:hypothetical protein